MRKKKPRIRKDLTYKPKGVAKKKAKTKKQLAPKTRNNKTWTEAQFWQFIRSALRNRTRFWGPKLEALKAARRPSQSANKRLKWEFFCGSCKQWFPAKSVEVHHLRPAGKLNSAADLPQFVERLFCEKDELCVICKSCHKEQHKK